MFQTLFITVTLVVAGIFPNPINSVPVPVTTEITTYHLSGKMGVVSTQ